MAYSKSTTPEEIGLAAADEGEGAATRIEDGPLVRVHVLNSEIEAQVLTDVLEREAIHFVIQSYRELAFDGLFIPQRGWGCILTREEAGARAAKVIGEALAAIGDPGTPNSE
jgi:hypothetical protein